MALSQQLDALEQQLAQLLGSMENLLTENRSLRQREQQLVRECHSLRMKNEEAGKQIELILQRLRANKEED